MQRESMRIAWLISLYPPYTVGGNEMLACDLVAALSARGHTVHVLTAHGRELDSIPHVHQVFHYNLRDKNDLFLGGRTLSRSERIRHHMFDWTTFRDVRRAILGIRPELVVVDNLYMASAAPLLAARAARCPVVAQVADKWLNFLLWDLGLLLNPHTARGKFFHQLYARLCQPIWRYFGKPDEIVSISNFIKEYYVQVGFPAEHITSMHLGVDTSLYTPRQEPHIRDNSLEIVFAGQLWEGKGPQVPIEALGLLRRQAPNLDLRLRIIGTGNEHFLRYLRFEATKHGMEDRIIFDGFVPLPTLAERLRHGDIFVFPSTWDEPFSITLVAAMSSGIPVIASSTGGTPEAFRDGVEGILIPSRNPQALADAILRLAQNPALREQMAQAAVALVRQKWSFDAYVDRLEQHYSKIVEKARR